MPANFDDSLGTLVRKVQLQQIFDAWEGVANAGVPLRLTTVSSNSVPAAQFRNLGTGGGLKVLSIAGATLLLVDETGTTLTLAAGTVGAPGISQAGDTDTGFYKPDVDRIGISLGGTKYMDWRAGTLEFNDRIYSSLGTLTSSKSAWYSIATWNSLATTFVHDYVNITDTTSATASLLAQWQVGSVDKLTVTKAGLLTLAGGVVATTGAFSSTVSMTALTATTGTFSGAVSTAGLLSANAGLLVPTAQPITLAGIAYTFPANNGDASQFLQTDGAGVLSWTTVAAADAGTLAGTTLAATVVSSSLTSLGTLTALALNGNLTFSGASRRIIAGTTGLYFRNNANDADNVAITDAGAVSIRAGLTALGATALGSSAQAAVSAAGLPSGTLAPRIILPASAFTPTSSVLGLVTTGSDKYELQYADGSAKDSAVSIQVPANYNGGNISIKLHWYIAGSSQQVYWNALVAKASAGGAVNGSPASVGTASATSNATTNLYNFTTITWSSSLPTAGDILELVVRRTTTEAWDTSTATANLRSVVVEFGS